ncbi:hypothetical protein AB0I72_13825 [Nocardiopsis sp. NPDC049922]|uniref:hypothetical protein n=1 Tax=Nocardiopsis sp. NPDC049922 TaxID=3155157 RepID=UPI0033D45E68
MVTGSVMTKPESGTKLDKAQALALLETLSRAGYLRERGHGDPSPDAMAEALAMETEDVDVEALMETRGRARKVSVSMPEGLTAAVQQRVGRGEFSRYVTEAVAYRFEQDRLAELSDYLEELYGPVPDELLAEAEAEWPDAG